MKTVILIALTFLALSSQAQEAAPNSCNELRLCSVVYYTTSTEQYYSVPRYDVRITFLNSTASKAKETTIGTYGQKDQADARLKELQAKGICQ